MAGKRILKLGIVIVALVCAVFVVRGNEGFFEYINEGEVKAAVTSTPKDVGDSFNYGGNTFTVYAVKNNTLKCFASSFVPIGTDASNEYFQNEISKINNKVSECMLSESCNDASYYKTIKQLNGNALPKIHLATRDDVNDYLFEYIDDYDWTAQENSQLIEFSAGASYPSVSVSPTKISHVSDLKVVISAQDVWREDKGYFFSYLIRTNEGQNKFLLAVAKKSNKSTTSTKGYGVLRMELTKFPDIAYITDVEVKLNDNGLYEDENSTTSGSVIGNVIVTPEDAYPTPILSIEGDNTNFSINNNNELIIAKDNITAGTYKVTVKAVQPKSNVSNETIIYSDEYEIIINKPYKKITDLIYTPDIGKDPLKLETNTSAGQIGIITAGYDTGTESGRGVRYELTNTKGNNDNAYFTLTDDGKLSITNDLTVAKTYNLEVTAYETEVDDTGTTVDVANKSYTKMMSLIVKDKHPVITGITFTPNYSQNKTGWNFGDTGINASGEKTGAFSFTGGTSGTIDATTGKDYKTYEIVDTDGNAITDTNFTISGNELQAKGQVPVGTYTLNIKVTDNNDETYTDTITIDVGKAENPFDWIDGVKKTTSLYYGDTLTLGVTGIGEGATVTYEPSPEVSGTTFTAGKPTSKFTVTAKATETSSYGETSKTHDFKIEKRLIYVKVQQKDSDGSWKDSVTIKQGQALPDKQVIENTSEANNKGLASTESSVTDAKLGTITYEYRQGNKVVSDPSSKAGTYDVVAVYTTSDYYTVTVKKGILIVTAPDIIDNTNKESYYEFQLNNGSKVDITKWQTEDIIIHPKHSSYTQMKVDNGTYQTGDQTYTKEGKNDVLLSFKDGTGATTSTIKETLKIDKTNPILTKVEVGELNGSVQAPGNGTFHYLLKNGADYKISASDAQSGIAKYNIIVTSLKSDGTIDSSKQPKKTSTPSTSGTFGGSITEQGYFQLDVEVEDAAGRKTSANPIKIKVKSTQTTLEVKGYINGDTNKPYDPKKWTNQSIQLKLNASDNTALTNSQISTDGTNFNAMTNGEHTVTNTSSINGETYYFKATNVDGDEVSTSIKINIDVDAPSAPDITWKDKSQNVIASIINTITFDKIFSKEVIASFASTDLLSGADTYSYKITEVDNKGNAKGSPITGKGASYSLSKNKNYKVEVTATDKAGNTSTVSTKTVQIDTEAPVISGVKDKNEYKQYYLPRYISVADSLSGVKTATYKTGSVTKDIIGEVNIMGVGEYQVYAEDHAGNKVTLNFKIVPLPDLSDIDGTDESKAIIDQIQKELDEIKNKIDQTQKDDYQEWIDDATDQWEKLRKKVVEHEETTSKVEGQGDTTFDPKTELIVEEIPKEQVPVLPRNAIKTYDVRLMKGDKEILPNGDIKVYLPYTQQETPIVYELNDDGSIKELTAKQENGFVTFVTNTLKKYAISNTAQKENKPNVCVVGPDHKADSNDDVCGSEGSKKNDDGSVTVPDGGKVIFPDKEIDAPDGAIIHPDGSVDFPDGTHFDPDGNETTKPDPNPNPDDNNDPTDDKVCAVGPDGKPNTSDDVCGEGNGGEGVPPVKEPDGSVTVPDGGSVVFPDGSEVELPDGGTIKPDGSVELPDGTIYDKDGNKKDPNDSGKKQCKLEGIMINKDSDRDGLPDINVDLNNDCIADINLDVDNDGKADIDIDTDGDGEADINIDLDKNGSADVNIALITRWIPDKNDCLYHGVKYDTMADLEPYLNVDDDHDGTPDRNIDDDGDGIPDRNVDSDWFDRYGSQKPQTQKPTVNGAYGDKNTGGVSTGDQTKWTIWWIVLLGTTITMGYSLYTKYKKKWKY